MELRRRQVDAHSTENLDLDHEALEDDDKAENHTEMEEMESGSSEIPPRSAIHGRKRKKSPSSKRSLMMSCLVLAIVALGGAYWYLGEEGIEQAIQATASSLLEGDTDAATEKHEVFKGVEVNTQSEQDNNPPLNERENGDSSSPQQENIVQPAPEPVKQAPEPDAQPKSKPSAVDTPSFERIAKHKVEVGETLYRISVKYYSSGKYADFLARHNNLKTPSDLISGTYIQVPFPPLK
ncbi:LysM peptidoglycan-binding domain-containing protein [Ammoniphilus sp. 3BR4]|uniref:LysM peptidoglycan-binding domain-containing protein n=1 Tax=Ammoniphilus sp. 3BR4 TaxID=3158265 RepID=UPI003465ADAA